MNILVIGSELDLRDCRKTFGERHHYDYNLHHTDPDPRSVEIVFNFNAPLAGLQSIFDSFPEAVIFTNTTFVSLADELIQFSGTAKRNTVFGFAGMAGFLDREILEVCALSADQPVLASCCEKLGTQFQVVADRAGLVTPRIICMIINEAYFALEGNTASREDIDKAMKTGTNYPLGPFEWAQQIGVDQVCQLLNAMHRATNDDRYLVCPLLQQEAAT